MSISLTLGIAVGLVLALTGAGGGIIAVPLLVFGLHLSIADAGPISLLAVGMAATLGAILGLKAGMVRYRAAMLIAVTGVAFTPLGNWLAHHLHNQWLTILFASVMLFVAYRTLVQARSIAEPERIIDLSQPCMRDDESGRFIWTAMCARFLAFSGLVAGLLSGLLGVGGGFVMVPVLRRFTNLDMKSTIATSLAVIAMVSIASILNSALSGNLNWAVAIPFGIGALLGMLSGSLIAKRVTGPYLEIGFACLTTFIALGMIVKLLMVINE
jgi:uncharacterized membrane protein YfcA